MTQETLGMNSKQRISGNERRTFLKGAGDLACVVAAESALAQQPQDGQSAHGERQATGARIATSVDDVTYDLLRRHGLTTVLRQSRIKRVAVPEGFSVGFPLFPRSHTSTLIEIATLPEGF
jgi:hypothetical protein